MDRNVNLRVLDGSKSSSLSARRAWIEMLPLVSISLKIGVALRKESVDRNIVSAFDVLAVSASLSARRAWIEINY